MSEESAHPLVLFDGICNLCESTVRFIIQHDKNARFRFASLQSEAAQSLMSEYKYADGDLNSVLLIANKELHRKSRAVLQIVRRLDGAWPLLFYLFFWVPKFIADPIYDFIGNRRYQWFGQKDECWIPTEDLRERFIEGPVEPD